MKSRRGLLALYFLFGFILQAQAQQVNIIPQPVSLDLKEGYFILDENTSLEFMRSNKELAALAQYFANHVKEVSGYSMPLNKRKAKTIRFELESMGDLGAEGYKLSVSPDAIRIRGNTKAGVFNGLQSLIQMLPAVRTNEALQVPAMDIADEPRFGWRGMMLDVSRHFYTVDAVKEFLDLMALYKMNTFHWHLTDNEGWRLEIKKYPKLTSVGAWRQEIPGSVYYKLDSTYKEPLTGKPYTYGGYYTQEQAREVVAYAQARNITVIPEIDIPGHSGAALTAYPEFSCERHQQQAPNSTLWNGVTDPAKVNLNYCAGNDSSFLFLQDVLTEVMAVFPSEYIHIGGDEVDKSYWKKCPRCQKRIANEGLKNEEELQSYFIQRMEKYLLAHDKKLLGWDEILEGGLAPTATVMSWRGEKGGISAAKQGHDVVMTPSDPLYFNRYQAGPQGEPFAARYSINTLERVYKYNPHSEALTVDERRHVLGAQANIWTEFISSVEHLEYMLLPRLPAIAEALWTPLEKKNFNSFVNRLNGWHFPNWETKGIRFHSLYYQSRSHEANREIRQKPVK
ncbi:hexosaminidase [Pontibacter ummariensis]|uniref:beta-N-acetylhexosaminidase n=1 Tax=Pontibacter ummariensis TaxID=1610492 RepID=A0A239LP36_9BACT|nr:beta-N-acetylhexosaminidase [Pontibacter ummariensis]PRY02912.1 hexosaminidase [Pontibacter ummariensis]SNT32447.1 hexosaminidase [Pontibacter ummariensis]